MDKNFEILIVDDDVDLSSNLQDILEAEGYGSVVAHDGHSALNLCSEKPFDLAVIDIRLPDILGLDLIGKLAELSSDAVYVIITGYASMESAIKAIRKGNIIAYETKPLDMDHFLALIKQVYERKQAEEALRDSEERYHQLFDNLNDALFLADVETRMIIETNQQGVALLGRSHDEIVGMHQSELHPPGKCDEYRQKFSAQIQQGRLADYDGEAIRKDGTIVPVRISGTPSTIHGQRLILGLFHDITERKQAEEALRESEERYRSLTNDVLDSSAVGIFILNSEFGVVWVNQSLERYFGLRRSEVIGKDKRQLIRERIKDIFDDPEGFTKMVFATYDNNTYTENFECHVLPDGEREERWLEHWSQPIRVGLYAGGRIEHYYDITERKQAEEALNDSEKRYRGLFENSSEFLFTLDLKGNFTDVNRAAEKLTGYTKAELLKMNFKDYAPRNSHRKLLRVFYSISKTGKPLKDFPVEAIIKDKTVKYFETSVSPLKKGNQIIGFEGSSKDITARKQAEKEIRQLNQYLESIIYNANVWLNVVDQKANIVLWNMAAERISGYSGEEVVGHDKIWEWLYPDEAYRKEITERVAAGLTKGVTDTDLETTMRCKNGQDRTISWNQRNLLDEDGDFIGAITIGRDITEQRQAQEAEELLQAELYQSQKLESIGTLASGVAHEINNPLTGMINYADLIVERVKDDELRKFAQGIMKEGNRVAEIVKNLLSFARQEEKQSHSPARLEDIIDASLTLVGAALRKDQITLEKEIAPDLPKVRCHSQQIQQVIINLLTNARDALNERYSGYHENKIIVIQAQPFEKDGVEWVRTTIEDHGNGISEEIIARVFDPFFTTKPRDVGTGLGLSVSYGIVRDHHGEMSVESKLGKYTRFHIDLRVDNGWKLG